MEMQLSADRFNPSTPVDDANVEARNVSHELLFRALGNPFLLRIPTVFPLLVIAVAAAETTAKHYLWWLVGLQFVIGIFTSSTAYRVKLAIKKQIEIRKAVTLWLTFETLSGVVWGLMMLPVAQTGAAGMPFTVIYGTIVVTLTAAAIGAAKAQGLAQALLLGFMLTSVPAILFYQSQVGLYGVLSLTFLPPGLLWVGLLLRRQAHDELKTEIENELLSTQLAKALSTSEYLSQRDNLTGLLNRNTFLRVAGELRDQHHSAGMVIIAIDLDHFKIINDEYGHAVGDQALVAAAQLMQSQVRASDVAVGPVEAFARWGGEEFVIALANCSVEQGVAIADRARKALEDHRDQEWPAGLQVTGSFGVTYWGKDCTIQEALKRADHAMYEAKAAGRNRVCLAAEQAA